MHTLEHQVGIREESCQACQSTTDRRGLKNARLDGKPVAQMLNMIQKLILAKTSLCLLFVGALNLAAAEKPAHGTLPVRGFCIASPSGNRVDEFIKFIEEVLAPRSVNVIILRVDYSFQFLSRPEMADNRGLSKEQAQKITAACQRHEIRINPLVKLLGPQS